MIKLKRSTFISMGFISLFINPGTYIFILFFNKRRSGMLRASNQPLPREPLSQWPLTTAQWSLRPMLINDFLSSID